MYDVGHTYMTQRGHHPPELSRSITTRIAGINKPTTPQSVATVFGFITSGHLLGTHKHSANSRTDRLERCRRPRLPESARRPLAKHCGRMMYTGCGTGCTFD